MHATGPTLQGGGNPSHFLQKAKLEGEMLWIEWKHTAIRYGADWNKGVGYR